MCGWSRSSSSGSWFAKGLGAASTPLSSVHLFVRFLYASCDLLASVEVVYMCMIATDMSMHAMIAGMVEVNSNALLEAAFAGGCRGLLVPSPHVGSGRMTEPAGAARGGDPMPRGPSSTGVPTEGTGVGEGGHRTSAGTSRGGRGEEGGSTSGSD